MSGTAASHSTSGRDARLSALARGVSVLQQLLRRNQAPRSPQNRRSRAGALVRLGLLELLTCVAWFPRHAQADGFCSSCEGQIGVGGTYHFWGSTGGIVLPVTVSWDENRYEVGVFRMANQQLLRDSNIREERLMANPYWAVSASRRWQVFARGPVSGFFGFGLAYRSESDDLSATRWDFASQLGARFQLPMAGSVAELTVRHWSNGGVRLPNHGQDFVTLTTRFDFR